MRLPSRMTRMKRARHMAGYSQAELAELLYVSRQTIVSIENERSIPSVTLALGIARVLDTTVEELFGRPRGF
jgi:putative transcriptional regulator